MMKAQTKMEKALEDKIERLEAQLADKDDLIKRLREDKNNLVEAMRQLEIDGKKVGVGFKPASELPQPEIRSISVPYFQAGEIFEKSRQFVKLRQTPGIRIVLSQMGDKVDIDVKTDK